MLFAFLYLILAGLIGSLYLKFTTGSISSWSQRFFANQSSRPQSQYFLSVLAFFCAAEWLGLIFMSWSVYLLGWFFSRLGPFKAGNVHPLLPANILTLVLLVFLLFLYYKRFQLPNKQALANFLARPSSLLSLKSKDRGKIEKETLLYFCSLLFFLCLAIFLMCSSYQADKDQVSAGFSVFSDFAPHTAIMSSFSKYGNWPTEYPHFAGDGISYHFMFFFLCANLVYGGLNLAAAVNLLSLLGMTTALVLLGSLAVALTARAGSFLLAPLLTVARSSMAFFTHLIELVKTYGYKPKLLWSLLIYQQKFIGDTPRDDWGLWSINVYANQRHLLPAVTILLLFLLLYLPAIRDNSNVSNDAVSLATDKNEKKEFFRRLLALTAPLLFSFAYWHGSVLITILMSLTIYACFSKFNTYYLVNAAAGLVGAVLQTKIFMSDSANSVSLRFWWGFIAEDRSLLGILNYLFRAFGFCLPLLVLLFIFAKRRGKIFIILASMPLLFAFTVSLTPDVTVNHKFIMFSLMLFNIPISAFLLGLFDRPKGKVRNFHTKFKLLAVRAAAIVLIFLLTITGLYEWLIFKNINKNKYTIFYGTAVNDWISTETESSAIFIAAPWHFHSFFLTGRRLYLGHSYYAWSAGHNTSARQELQSNILAGKLEARQIQALASEGGPSYLLIDRDLREHEQFYVNESFFAENFLCLVVFEDELSTVIYDLTSPIT